MPQSCTKLTALPRPLPSKWPSTANCRPPLGLLNGCSSQLSGQQQWSGRRGWCVAAVPHVRGSQGSWGQRTAGEGGAAASCFGANLGRQYGAGSGVGQQGVRREHPCTVTQDPACPARPPWVGGSGPRSGLLQVGVGKQYSQVLELPRRPSPDSEPLPLGVH